MHGPPPITIDMPSNLDDQVAAELITLLRAFGDALEQHYAGALARQQQPEWESRQPSLWPDDDPPF